MLKKLFILKSLTRFQEDSADLRNPALPRTLGTFSLVMLGLGMVIGAGIFTVPGIAAARFAGPGIVFSFLIAGALCAVAGLCYSEMAGMLPVAGSAYSYSYATLGELPAWVIGWDLCLEYGVGAILVSVAWSGYFLSLLQDTLGLVLPDALRRLTCGPLDLVTLASGVRVHGLWNLPAALLPLVLTFLLWRGTRGSARLNNAIVALKILIVLVFVALGLGLVSRQNLLADPAAPGLLALVPAREMAWEAGHQAWRYGWGAGGVLTGVGVVFLAYIGFDAVSTTGLEARRPGRDVPVGIMATVVVSTVLYALVALVLTGVVPYRELGSEPIAHGIDRIIHLRGWGGRAESALSAFVRLGALAGLTSGVLVTLLGQARILYAMGRDGLLPWFGGVHPRHGTPGPATLATGAAVTLGAGFLPLPLLAELASIGTLMAFAIVCLAVPILRRTLPGAPRPFRIPAPWFLGLLGAGTALFLMTRMPPATWVRLLVWLYLGFAIYFLHGRRASRLQRAEDTRFGSRWNDALSLAFHILATVGAGLAFHRGWHPLLALALALLAFWTARALVTNDGALPTGS